MALAAPDGDRPGGLLHARLAGTSAVPGPVRGGTALRYPRHPELQALEPGDRIYMGSGAFTSVTEVEPPHHLVAFETFVLRPVDGRRTRLIVRTRGMGYLQPAIAVVAPDAGPLPRLIASVVRHVPGVDLLARGFDFLVADPLHHYMDTGMLKGIKGRAEETTSRSGGEPERAPAAASPQEL